MGNFFVPVTSDDQWKQLLADPDKQEKLAILRELWPNAGRRPVVCQPACRRCSVGGRQNRLTGLKFCSCCLSIKFPAVRLSTIAVRCLAVSAQQDSLVSVAAPGFSCQRRAPQHPLRASCR